MGHPVEAIEHVLIVCELMFVLVRSTLEPTQQLARHKHAMAGLATMPNLQPCQDQSANMPCHVSAGVPCSNTHVSDMQTFRTNVPTHHKHLSWPRGFGSRPLRDNGMFKRAQAAGLCLPCEPDRRVVTQYDGSIEMEPWPIIRATELLKALLDSGYRDALLPTAKEVRKFWRLCSSWATGAT